MALCSPPSIRIANIIGTKSTHGQNHQNRHHHPHSRHRHRHHHHHRHVTVMSVLVSSSPAPSTHHHYHYPQNHQHCPRLTLSRAVLLLSQENFLPFFSEIGYDCHAVSLRAQGGSDRVEGPYAAGGIGDGTFMESKSF